MATKKVGNLPRTGLLVNIKDEDEAWAVSQDRWNCAVVRAVQRQLPEALYVTADKEAVRFTIPEDGPDGVRYTCDPPPEGLLKAFDLEHRVPEEYRSFTIVAREAKPMSHNKRNASIKAGTRQGNRQRTREYRAKSRSVINRQTNRFLDSQAEGQ